MRLRWLAGLLLVVTLAACATPSTGPSVTEDPLGSALTPSTIATATPGIGVTAPALTHVCPPEVPTQVPDGFKQWTEPPASFVDTKKIYIATFKLPIGDFKVQLFADKAPITVNNFIFLACQGYYDNTTFHRVLEGFMAQGGDPTASGSGGPGYQFEDEIRPDVLFDQAGLLAMANAGPGTNGSQFFITYDATPWLNGGHTIFGKVIEGMEVVQAIKRRDPEQGPDFPGETLITVDIATSEVSLIPTPTPTPIPVKPDTKATDRPLAKLDFSKRENLYTHGPDLVIDQDKTYTAVIETTQGTMTVELYTKDALVSVNNFVVLAKLGYWDNFPISFAQAGEFAVTGSPQARPDSDAGYTLPSEIVRPNLAGSVGYWFRQDVGASSSSNIYFMLIDNPGYDTAFTVFGGITEGLEVAQKLTIEDKVVKITIQEK